MPQSKAQPPVDNSEELKAGHPPAVKVGNMRVVQRTHSTSSDKNDEEQHSHKGEAAASGDGQSVPTVCSFAPKQVVNKQTGGVPDNLTNQALLTESVKQIHDKPQASHEYRSNHPTKPNMILQPKK